MDNQAFERELPKGYRLAKTIDGTDLKFGLIFNGIALVVWLLVTALFLPLLYLVAGDSIAESEGTVASLLSGVVIGFLPFIAYIVCHELVHGWAYKRKTGEKLTFGISWSCAFCGVPGIYTYRSTALFALLSPLVFFSALFLLLIAACLVVAGGVGVGGIGVVCAVYSALVFIFGMHLGGCSGDAYVTLLLWTKFKDERTLIRDTGPVQYIYVPEGEPAENGTEGAVVACDAGTAEGDGEYPKTEGEDADKDASE